MREVETPMAAKLTCTSRQRHCASFNHKASNPRLSANCASRTTSWIGPDWKKPTLNRVAIFICEIVFSSLSSGSAHLFGGIRINFQRLWIYHDAVVVTGFFYGEQPGDNIVNHRRYRPLIRLPITATTRRVKFCDIVFAGMIKPGCVDIDSLTAR